MRNLIVVGSGIAGLFTALSAHRGVRDVLIVTKEALEVRDRTFVSELIVEAGTCWAGVEVLS